MKHKGFVIFWILLAQLSGPISNAQFSKYYKLYRGQPCPYDTCVATEINQWRRESAFINTLRSENQSLQRETISLQSEINLADSTAKTYADQLAIASIAIIRKDSLSRQMTTAFDDIHRIATDALEPKKWWQKDWVIFALGALTGYIITR